jgi:hypothetical protein
VVSRSFSSKSVTDLLCIVSGNNRGGLLVPSVANPLRLALVVFALVLATPGGAQVQNANGTASAPIKPLARSWRDLRLGMTPSQFAQVCKKFDLGALKKVSVNDFQFASGSPVAEHCLHGCDKLEVYTCKKNDPAYGAFLAGRAIVVFGSALRMHSEPCTSLCRGVGVRQTNDCGSNSKCQACSRCLDSANAQDIKENEAQTPARIARFKFLYGPPQVSSGKEGSGDFWVLWRDIHTQIVLSELGEVEIDDFDANRELNSIPEKLYGLIVVRQVVGFASFDEASQVGRHLSKGGLSMKDLGAFTDAVTLAKNTLVTEVGKSRMPESGSVEERSSGMASQYLVVSGPYKRLLVWVPTIVEITTAPLTDCTVPEIREKHSACKPTNPYGKPSM